MQYFTLRNSDNLEMKATLEFNLPEEQEDFELSVNVYKYYSVLFELNSFLRSKIKYEQVDESAYNAYYDTREKLQELLTEYKLDL